MSAALPIGVLGAGSWGTALAWLLAGRGEPVRLFCRDDARAAELSRDRENRKYLPGLRFPEAIECTADPAGVAGCRLLVVAVPSEALRKALAACAAVAECPDLVLATKGLERSTGARLSTVAREVVPRRRIAVLSGPNLSGEVVRGIPTATVVAGDPPAWLRELQRLFGTRTFRVYTNSDLAGVELGGALKNPMAIAAGISDGLGYGANTRAALLTRGLAEMVRLGVAAGGRPETFAGLSGLGDLLATAHSPLSRNYRTGLALGRGATLDEALAPLGQVAEGVPTTAAACTLARSLGVDVPILDQLSDILFEGAPVQQCVEELLSRPLKGEA